MPKYNDNILNYYNDDTHIGSFDVNDKNVGTGLVGSPSCGDVMKLQIKIQKNKNGIEIIKDAKILVFGCGSAKASSSYIAEKLVGLTLEEAKKIKNTDIVKALGLPKIKLHCSVLAEEAIKRSIQDYSNKKTAIKSSNKKVKTDIDNSDTINNNDFKLDVSEEAIKFTYEQLKKVEKEKKIKIKGIILSLEEGHCGLMYKVKYAEPKDNLNDYILFLASTDDNKYKVNIFVLKDLKDILNQTQISYKEENLKKGLIFKNPNEKGRCNCGKNFFTEESKNKNKKDSKKKI